VKVRRLKRYLRRAARDPAHVVLVFLDEMGYSVCLPGRDEANWYQAEAELKAELGTD
jgi:hypothetical protein